MADDTAEKKKINMKYRTLGRTGLKVSEISFGAIAVQDTGIAPLAHAVGSGVNYIDTAECYGGGNSERTLAEFLKNRRKDVILATKWHTNGKASKESLIQSFNGSLSRMGVEDVDIIQIHGADNVEQVGCPGVHEAFQELKKQGKVRFLGVTTHTNQETVIREAVRLGTYDMVLVAYNFLMPESMGEAIAEAGNAGVGIVAMKVAAAAREPKAKELFKNENIVQASLKWALKNQNVHTIIVTMSNAKQAEEDIAVAGESLTANEENLLSRYAQAATGGYCRLCGKCDMACPRGVKASSIMRSHLYWQGYGNKNLANSLYNTLSASENGGVCDGCGICRQACPYGLAVAERVKEVHTRFAWSPTAKAMGPYPT
jgi:predicted aldo/keto reductase-like oxidoreductase